VKHNEKKASSDPYPWLRRGVVYRSPILGQVECESVCVCVCASTNTCILCALCVHFNRHVCDGYVVHTRVWVHMCACVCSLLL
jgi:hypothetical protein